VQLWVTCRACHCLFSPKRASCHWAAEHPERSHNPLPPTGPRASSAPRCEEPWAGRWCQVGTTGRRGTTEKGTRWKSVALRPDSNSSQSTWGWKKSI